MDFVIMTVVIFSILKLSASLFKWVNRGYDWVHRRSPFWAKVVENLLIVVTASTYINQVIGGVYGYLTGNFSWFLWASWISLVYPQWAMTAVCLEIIRRRCFRKRRDS